MKTIATLTGEGFACVISERPDGRVIFTADADIDADGSPHAYHPDSKSGTDFLANAKSGNQWVGVVTKNGFPLTQDKDDLAPGFYISSTRYEWPDEWFAVQGLKIPPHQSQRRYVDGEKISFCVVPPVIISGVSGVVMGAACRMTNLRNGKVSMGMVGDSGPSRKTGEVSPKAARELGLEPSPKNGGTDDPIIQYEIWPGVAAEVDGRKVPLMKADGNYILV